LLFNAPARNHWRPFPLVSYARAASATRMIAEWSTFLRGR